jgi:hypothetical protein
MDFREMKKHFSKFNITKDYNSIMNWESPILTGFLLILVNILYYIYLRLEMPLLSFIAYRIMIVTLIYIIKNQVSGSQKE